MLSLLRQSPEPIAQTNVNMKTVETAFGLKRMAFSLTSPCFLEPAGCVSVGYCAVELLDFLRVGISNLHLLYLSLQT